MPIPHICQTCGQTFTRLAVLLLHAHFSQHVANPFFCILCNLSFRDDHGQQSHTRAKHPALAALADGDESESESESESHLDGHGDNTGADENVCTMCKFTTEDIIRFNDHLKRAHNWCFECSKGFATAGDLARHVSSLAHAPRTMSCPSGSNCECRFKSASGIAHHMENGCHMDRHQVTRRVKAMDKNNVISIDCRIEGPELNGTTKFIATEDSFDGQHYVCFLCQKKCRSLAGLNAHLNSAAHDASEFKCPSGIGSHPPTGLLIPLILSHRYRRPSSSMSVPHSCLTCGQNFVTVNLMLLHVHFSRGHLVNPLFCVLCNLSFQDHAAWQLHQYSNHPQLLTASVLAEIPLSTPLAASDGLEPSGSPIDSDANAGIDRKVCVLCNAAYRDISLLNSHLETVHHWCFLCSKGFKTAESRSQHDESLAHVPRTLRCPIAESNCRCKFKSASGVAHHLENGRHMNRHQVTHAVKSMDRNHIISINHLLSDAPKTTTTTFIATHDSFDGKHYVCFLCQKKFRSLGGLNAHLNSAAHDASEFKCPRCESEFKIVSALAQHIESRVCAHRAAAIGSGSEEVENYIMQFPGNFRQLRF
ncbi:unnamed protein product [Cyclocybe aegerita]|uniref:C2H2-type domain-containing protein n=1 Tax=Cyclocybe aegerita TaxID=1973307 RepID=A0A8S0WDC4_CYCAE|nr:unnamed protein product [Cyclocybe aegerita]